MDIPEVDVDAAAQLHEEGSAVFLDVRDPDSFQQAHVPGAIHATDATIDAFLEETARDAKIVVYCYHGNSSLGGAAFLMQKGFSDVASMSGGFESWRGRHPEETGA